MPRTKPLPNLNHQQALNLCRRQRATINRLERMVVQRDKALGERLKDLSETIKERDSLAARLADADVFLSDCQLHSRVRAARVDALLSHIAALSQRYAGVKLDTQQFTFAQAQEWLRNEDVAVAAMLNRVVGDAGRDQCAQRQEAA